RVDDRHHAPVVADHVDGRLAQDLLAAPAGEGVAGARVDQGDGQRPVVDVDDLAVLAEQDPGEASLELDRLEQVGPQPAYVDQRQPARRTRLIELVPRTIDPVEITPAHLRGLDGL